jgi:hypothetical protein
MSMIIIVIICIINCFVPVAASPSHLLHDAALDPYFTAWSDVRSLLKKARERALAVAAAAALAVFFGAIFLNL